MMRSKLWLFSTLMVLVMLHPRDLPAQLTDIKLKSLMADGSTGAENRHRFLMQESRLARSDELANPSCRLTQVFAEEISLDRKAEEPESGTAATHTGKSDVKGKNSFHLSMYRVERRTEELPSLVGVEVVSMLIRDGVERDEVWLRAGPTSDTGWIPLLKTRTLGADDAQWPFRGCHAPIVGSAKYLLNEPCSRPECQSQATLSPTLNAEGAIALVPGRSVVDDWPMGTRGVATWLARYRSALSTRSDGDVLDSNLQFDQEKSKRPEEDPTPSSKEIVPRSRQYAVTKPWPDKEHFFLANPQDSNRFGSQGAQDGRLVSYMYSNPGAELMSMGEPTAILASRPSTAKSACQGKQKRVFVPRSRQKINYFEWDWVPLANARTPAIGRTDTDGCLREGEPLKDFKAFLDNRNLSITTLEDPKKSVGTYVDKNGPLIFSSLGGSFYENLIAGNIFSWSNFGLASLDREVFPWISPQVANLKVFQRRRGVGCRAERTIGKLYLPMTCPGFENLVPKGMCGDVVLHELTHEMLGSLVGLATNGNVKLVRDRKLNEGLADFFSSSFAPGSEPYVFAELCSRRNLYQGDQRLERETLAHSLLELEDDAIRTIGRLAVLAIFYGSTDAKLFLAEFLEFAKKGELDDERFCRICKVFKKQLGYEDALCKSCPSYDELWVDSGSANGLGSDGEDIGEDETVEAPTGSPQQAQWKLGATWDTDSGSSVPRAISVSDETWLVAVSQTGELIGREGLGSKELAPEQELRLVEGFSHTKDGRVQGWTLDHRAVNLRFDPSDSKPWAVIGQTTSPHSLLFSTWLAHGGPLILQEDPRVEVVGIKPFELVVGDWSVSSPKIHALAWGQEIDPQSLQVGSSFYGTVLAVKNRHSGEQRFYRLKLDPDGARLRPLENAWSVFPEAKPGVIVRWHENGGAIREAHEFEIEESRCKAPPYLKNWNGRTLVVTCDGVITSIQYVSPRPRRGPTLFAPGVVEPIPGLGSPIRMGFLTTKANEPRDALESGGEGANWIVGPFIERNSDQGASTLWILDPEANALERRLPNPVLTLPTMTGGPEIGNLNDDRLDEVVTIRGSIIEIWNPREAPN